MFYFETPTYFDYLPIEIHNIIAKHLRLIIHNDKHFLNFEFKNILSSNNDKLLDKSDG